MARQRINKARNETNPQTIELLARMSVRGSYRIPIEGRSTSPVLRDSDVAGAVGMMRAKLSRALCVAVVCRAGRDEIMPVVTLAHELVCMELARMRQCPFDIHARVDNWRIRLVILDAIHGLIWPHHRISQRERAWNAKMRETDYGRAYRVISAVLHQAQDEGETEFSMCINCSRSRPRT